MESNRTEQNKETPVGIGVEMKIHSLAKIAIGLGAVGGVYLLIQKRRNASSMATASAAPMHGFVRSGFEAVREAFIENFVRRREIGAACCVYHNGEKVIDLWGGVRNKTTGEPWEEDTMALGYSAD